MAGSSCGLRSTLDKRRKQSRLTASADYSFSSRALISHARHRPDSGWPWQREYPGPPPRLVPEAGKIPQFYQLCLDRLHGGEAVERLVEGQELFRRRIVRRFDVGECAARGRRRV